MKHEYNTFASERLKGKYGRMESWRLVRPYLEGKKCLDAGMDDFITKPIRREFVEERINSWIASHATE